MSVMEQSPIETRHERHFDLERAEALRNVAQRAGVSVLPQAGTGAVLNHLLDKYPDYHPATTLGTVIRGYDLGLTTLALDIANCEEIMAETGDDLPAAIAYGTEIVASRCRPGDNYSRESLGALAYRVLVGPGGRLSFAPHKAAEEIDPFRHLESLWG